MSHISKPRFVMESEADPSLLTGRKIAVVGYGNLGRSVALNLRDSGCRDIVVSEIAASARELALRDGFTLVPTTQAAAESDIVFVLVSDEQAPSVYPAELAGQVRPGTALVFASGYNLAFGLLKPAHDLDVLMIAPRMLGPLIRSRYQKGLGVLSYISVEQDASGGAWPTLLALTRGLGALRTGSLVLTAAQEAHLDLFIEQSVGPEIGSAIMTAFRVGQEAGLPAEALVLEMYMSGEMSQTFQEMADVGFFHQVRAHGFTAMYGGMVRTLVLDADQRADLYRQVLREIKDGSFAQELQAEVEAGYPSLGLSEEMLAGHNPMAEAERTIRAALPGFAENRSSP